MNHWPRSDWPGYPGSQTDSESSSQLQPPQSSPLWGLPASGNGNNLNLQSQSPFPGDINIRPTVTPEFRLAVSEISPAHTATASYNAQPLGYPVPHWQDGVGDSRPGFDSQSQVEAEFQPGSASQAADAASYNNSNTDSHSQDDYTGGSQCQPLVSDIPVSDTASYSFQLSHSQEPAEGGSQNQSLASGVPAPIAPYMHQGFSSQPADGSQYQPLASGIPAPPYMHQGSSSQEPAGGGQYQPPFSVPPACNSAPYNDFNPHLQDRAGGSNPSLQSGVQFPTGGWLHRAVSRSLHHGSSDADQNTLQAASAPSQTFPNPASFEPAQTQSSLSGLGANVPNDQDHRLIDPEPESMFDRLSRTRNVKQRVARASPYKTPVPSKPPRSSRPVTILQIPSWIIDGIKKDASSRMKTTIFNQSLFPSTQNVVEWAKSALDDAAAVHIDNKDELAAWRLRKEGQTALSQLKGTIKRLHTNSREYAKGFVAGGYGLSLDIFKDATNIIPSRQAYASFLVSNNNFLDTFVQRITTNGQLEWFRVPFAHSGVIGMVEYMLIDQQFRLHVAFDSPGWEMRLKNVIALAGTICRWIVSRYSANGWFGDSELYTLENESCYADMIARMTSLSGSEEMLFRELLLTIRSVFSTLAVY